MKVIWGGRDVFIRRQLKESECHISKKEATEPTFSETRLLLPFNSSGAIQGSVPRTPPEISVWHLTFDKPKSPTYKNRTATLMSGRNHWYQRCLICCPGGETNSSLNNYILNGKPRYLWCNHTNISCTLASLLTAIWLLYTKLQPYVWVYFD